MISSAIFAQVTAECPYTLQWVPLSPKIASSQGGSGLPCKTRFLGPIRAHRPNGISIGSAVSPQTTVECTYTLQWDAHSPPKFLPLPMGGSEPASNTWSPLTYPSPQPKRHLDRFSRFCSSHCVTDRQTDRQTTLLGL